MNSYFWCAECANNRKSGVIDASSAKEAHKKVSDQLNDNSWHSWVITKLERIE